MNHVFTYSFCVNKKFTLGCNLYSQPDNRLGNNRFLFNPGSISHFSLHVIITLIQICV